MAEITGAFQVINRLVEAGIIRKYAVAGAVATLNYIEPTVTEDLDVLISVEDLVSKGSGIVTLAPLISPSGGSGIHRVQERRHRYRRMAGPVSSSR